MLTSFQIDNFRAFRRLRLPKLGHVNLIVGRNNTGKTMLLEALRLYSSRASTSVMSEILAQRDEFVGASVESGTLFNRQCRVHSLFFNRQMNSKGPSIVFSSDNDNTVKLTLAPTLLKRRINAQSGAEEWLPDESAESDSSDENLEVGTKLGMAIQFGTARPRIVDPDVLSRNLVVMKDPRADDGSVFVPSKGLSSRLVESWWDRITLTDAEERILQCLRLLAPVQRISLISGGGGERPFMAKLEGEHERVPLRSLGDGAQKIFEYALALEGSRNSKLLLIDEIENGIHYSVHEDLWRFIIEAARRTNVQVFATTHSWDCVMAFQSAIDAQPEIDAYGIRLFRSAATADIDAVILDRRDLATATRDQIDFR